MEKREVGKDPWVAQFFQDPQHLQEFDGVKWACAQLTLGLKEQLESAEVGRDFLEFDLRQP
eukprot:10335172-Lingulodinium_polyedra.AAC.1